MSGAEGTPRLLVVASNNKHKVQEIAALLSDLDFKVVAIDELGDFPDVIEDGDTFQENARKKAVETMERVHELVLADDSGLEVDALDGAPGVYSARFAMENGASERDDRNNAKLLRLLDGIPESGRGAQFRSVVALAVPEGPVEYAEGICRGRIEFAARGDNGFGYDPLFVVPEYEKTFAELDPEVKNQISHRARAMQKMKQTLIQYQNRAK